MYKFASLPGDGIGTEVVNEALKVMKAASEVYGFKYDVRHWPYGADYCIQTGGVGKGVMLPDSVWKECKELDAILLGAIGDPRFETGVLERAIVGALRFGLDLYVNLRPLKLYSDHLCPIKGKGPDDFDIMVVRENSEDGYVGIHGFLKKNTPDEVALHELIYTRKGTERIIRYAFDLCKKRNKKHRLALVDKANAIAGHDIYRRTFQEVAKEYPDIQTEMNFIDATCMWLVKNPEAFDTIVTTNMFGDIMTDLGAQLIGGLGIAAGGNINPGKVSMFEPIHGSAPKHKGKNVANPLATILSMGMMLEHVGEKAAAALVEQSVASILRQKKLPDLSARSGFGTNQVGDMVVAELRALAKNK